MIRFANLPLLAALALFVHAPGSAAEEVDHSAHSMHEMPGMDHSMPMAGLLGGPASREASGTAWQPASAPHEGHHLEAGVWTWMLHGTIQAVYTDQGGPRGDDGTYTPMMFMAMGSRPLGDGRFGLRAMLSPEVVQMGKAGYPLLLQTGETADGVTHLIDRQHPHDLYMELAATYSAPLTDALSGFVYLAPVGEPALGPPVFMHRFSGMEFPAAPISHHWLDSTHITYSVATVGATTAAFKYEASMFRGREPDQQRYDLETGAPDSWSARVTWNPTTEWSFQASVGDIHSPEQLEPAVDVFRTTASAMYGTARFGGHWQTTLAWGRNDLEDSAHDQLLDAWLLESTWRMDGGWTVLGRFEHAHKNELFQDGDPAGDPHDAFHVNSVNFGALRELSAVGEGSLAIGAMLTKSLVPTELEDDYGADPSSVTVFLRLRL